MSDLRNTWINVYLYITYTYIHHEIALLRKNKFALNKNVQPNASKFAMFMKKENPCSFFRFSFTVTAVLEPACWQYDWKLF